MHILDIILGIFLLVFLFKGSRDGFVQSFVGLIGLILIIILVTRLGPFLKLNLMLKFGFNDILALFIAYILIAFIVFLVTHITIKILHLIVKTLHLGWINRLLGTIFGLLKGVVIIAILLAVMDLAPKSKTIHEFTSQSLIVQYVRDSTKFMYKEYPNMLDEDGTLRKKLKTIEDRLRVASKKTKEKLEDKIDN